MTPPPRAAAAPDPQAMQRVNDAMRAGRLPEARTLLEALATAGAHPGVFHLLGEVLFVLGDHAEAERRLMQAVAAAPGFVAAQFALGLLRVKQDRFAEAREPLTACLEADPRHEGAAFNLGRCLEHIGLGPEALQCYRLTIELNPGNGRAYNNIGTILEANGRGEDAFEYFVKATQVEPTLHAAWNNAGRTAEKAERLDVADVFFRKAAELDADPVGGIVRYADFLIRHTRAGEAERVLRAMIEQHPDEARLCAAVSLSLTERGQYTQAAEEAEKAIALAPELDEGYRMLGRALNQSGQFTKAAEVFLTGLDYAGNRRSFAYEAGANLRGAKQVGRALEMFLLAVFGDEGLKQSAEEVAAHVLATGTVPDWVIDDLADVDQKGVMVPMVSLAALFGGIGDHRTMRRIYDQFIDVCRGHLNPWSTYAFTANYDPDITALDLFRHYQGYKTVSDLSALQAPLRPSRGGKRDRLRIGYLSPDFRSHAMINFIKPILENHDRDAVEIYAYGELKVGDGETRWVQDRVDGWRLTTKVRDEDVVRMIREDEVDILVDLAGHTGGHRLGIFPHRPAPVTATWLGYLYTTAVPGVDYFIGDAVSTPPGCDHLFTEKIVRLPHYLACYTPSAKAPEEIAPLPADAAGHITFGNCSRLVRVNPQVLRAWAEILNRVPTARLVLDHHDYGDAWCNAYMTNRLREAGAPMDRVTLYHSGDYWGFYARTDVVLDTFPHNSGTTTCEALWMGVPVLTIADRPPVGRLGPSMLDTVGHPELTGWSVAEYVRKAMLLAADVDRLRVLRGSLRDDLRRSPIMDGRRFMRNMETAYRAMWQNAVDGVVAAIDVFEDAAVIVEKQTAAE
ncbi:tetratricopeptide repeat protein [Caenispirillum bisanense]|uniref:protein O-GlcNAc transferase n=1 Tax=Caenispirillum bisanense TaxID=414052 RepID=A0A286GXI5_9PROT|nr:tetratricopeptide repeat protein [Caenispirillum bisanense]SOE00192.1 Predicted O-linked N-acetylglucosamine transferase, SPINDLY family [Caenispirillum bisanense]